MPTLETPVRTRKEPISIAVKRRVWSKCSIYPSHEDITRCSTCPSLVRIPCSIKPSGPSDATAIYVNGERQTISGVAEFGHVIAESNGGKATEENLIIQCKTCNVRQGAKDIETCQLVYDCDMLDAWTDPDTEMGENVYSCQGVCSSGQKCKNKTVLNRRFCHIHLTS